MQRGPLFAVLLAAACARREVTPEPVVVSPPIVPESPREVPVTSASSEAIDAFRQGRYLWDEFHPVEATAAFARAIELDPSFAQAHAWLGLATPGPDAIGHLEQAVALAADLPEAERLQVESLLAWKQGDEEKARSLLQRIAAIVPDDWRVHADLGEDAFHRRDWDGAVLAFEKATALEPDAGPAWNMLGYTYLELDLPELAIGSFDRYVALRPGEPNPRDSLAEALMRAGRFAEAEAMFTEATEVAPEFWQAWEGVALVRFFRGDEAGGMEALGRATEVAVRPHDQLLARAHLARALLTHEQTDAATTILDGTESQARTAKDPVYASIPLQRAWMLREGGDPVQALDLVDQAELRATEIGLRGAEAEWIRRSALAERVFHLSRAGRTAEAEQALVMLDTEAAEVPSNVWLRSTVSHSRGLVARAREDRAAAIEHLRACIPQDAWCRWDLARTLREADKAADAETIERELRSEFLRDWDYLYVWRRLGGATEDQVAVGE